MLTLRGVSGGRVPSKGGAGVAESLVCWIGTVGIGSIEDPSATWEGETRPGDHGFREVRARRGTAGGVESDWSKP